MGLMIDGDDVNIVEFNVRFGDPETQVVLPRLETDLCLIFEHISKQTLNKVTLEWNDQSAVGVVMASGGYPESYEKNKEITGLNSITNNCHVVHAGTALSDNKLLTNGGRVLCVVGQDKQLATAIERTYAEVSKISFEQAYYRQDIGKKGLQ